MGWQVGDRIGIAPTTGAQPGQPPQSEGTVHRVTRIGSGGAFDGEVGYALDISPPLPWAAAGGNQLVEGFRVGIAAEVVNLARSVIISGDDFSALSSEGGASPAGLHTIMAGGGLMRIEYARVEKCGQRMVKGRYCLHLHYMGDCPDCAFIGNAIEDSAQGGITIHETHSATIRSNVLWNTRGNGIYTEDGNEMGNRFIENVVVCSTWQECYVDTTISQASATPLWRAAPHTPPQLAARMACMILQTVSPGRVGSLIHTGKGPPCASSPARLPALLELGR
eukprot:scaffold279738_cov31-Tisochrysis_lutea.AAC.3